MVPSFLSHFQPWCFLQIIQLRKRKEQRIQRTLISRPRSHSLIPEILTTRRLKNKPRENTIFHLQLILFSHLTFLHWHPRLTLTKIVLINQRHCPWFHLCTRRMSSWAHWRHLRKITCFNWKKTERRSLKRQIPSKMYILSQILWCQMLPAPPWKNTTNRLNLQLAPLVSQQRHH